MELDLKPCPFCGTFDTIIHAEHSGTWIECLKCGAQGPFTYGDTDAVKAWNTRAAKLCGVMAAEKGETMTSDEKRSKVAERLRILASHAPSDKDYVLDALGLYPGEYIDGFDPYCVNELADLIDRPTCQMVECAIEHGSRSWGMRCTACGNEFEHMKPGFGWRFCPSCGAEVVEDD